MKCVRNKRIQDYLGEYGVFPKFTDGEDAYYSKCPFLFELLDKYFIENTCLPNKYY